MKPVLLLAIMKHDFDPGQLFKIDPQLKDWPRDSSLQLLDAGVLIKAEHDVSHKEYLSTPSSHLLHHHHAPAYHVIKHPSPN